MTVLVIMLMTGTGLAKRDIISPNLHGYENRLSSLQSPDKPSHIDRLFAYETLWESKDI